MVVVENQQNQFRNMAKIQGEIQILLEYDPAAT